MISEVTDEELSAKRSSTVKSQIPPPDPKNDESGKEKSSKSIEDSALISPATMTDDVFLTEDEHEKEKPSLPEEGVVKIEAAEVKQTGIEESGTKSFIAGEETALSVNIPASETEREAELDCTGDHCVLRIKREKNTDGEGKQGTTITLSTPPISADNIGDEHKSELAQIEEKTLHKDDKAVVEQHPKQQQHESKATLSFANTPHTATPPATPPSSDDTEQTRAAFQQNASDGLKGKTLTSLMYGNVDDDDDDEGADVEESGGKKKAPLVIVAQRPVGGEI